VSRAVLAALALLALTACATKAPVPRKVPPPPAARPAPSRPVPPAATPAPLPPLSPRMSAEQERSIVEATEASIGATDRVLRSLERRVAGPQRETFLTAQGFLEQARQALAMREVERAATLAGKARVLSDDLAARLR
jgi:hypothetical protein